MQIYCYKYSAGTLTLNGIVDNFESFVFKRSYSGIGQFTITLDGKQVAAQLLIDSDIIRAGQGLSGVITKTTEQRSDTGYTLTVTGYELKYLASKRIVIPPTGHSHVKLWGMSAARVVKRLLELQLTDAGDTRAIPGTVSIDGDAASSEIIDYSGRYTSLSDDIQTICSTYNIGWYADLEGGAIAWHVFTGKDRTSSQSTNSRLILSFKYDTIADAEFTSSRHNATYGVVAGQGEGVDRAIVSVGSGTGFDLTETFIDARDIQSTTAPEKPDIDERYDEPQYPTDEVNAAKAQMTGDEEHDKVLTAYIEALEKQYNTSHEAWEDNDSTWNAYDTKVTEYTESVDAMYEALYARGKEKMAAYGDSRTMEMTPSELLKRDYKCGFDLGDKGTLLDLGVDFTLTEIEEVYENGNTVLRYTYGYDTASLANALKRIDGKFSSLMGVEVISNG